MLERGHKCVIVGCVVQCNPPNLSKISEMIFKQLKNKLAFDVMEMWSRIKRKA